MTQLDKYLSHVQEQELLEIEEDTWFMIGFGALMASLVGLSIWGSIVDDRKYPRHPKWHKMVKDYEKLYRKCASYYPDDYTKVKGGVGVGDIGAEIDYEDYKANPERIKCQMTARLNHLKKFIKWISTAKAEEICKYNHPKGMSDCYAYVMQIKEARVDELRDLTRVLSASNKSKPLNRIQFTKIARVVNPKLTKKLKG